MHINCLPWYYSERIQLIIYHTEFFLKVETIRKYQTGITELKNTITEMENSGEEFSSRQVEERISELTRQ